ncbi:MAG: VWA domain-containing protein [Oscillospiraceae bacterium]|nr:VWA domain-containing protein [Oscillospiraceae bacterium]
MKRNTIIKRLLAATLCLCMSISGLSGFNILAADPDIVADTNTKTNGTIPEEYKADGNTMDSYTDMFQIDKTTQYAGRVWSDKTVSIENIKLDMETDGYVGEIKNNSDFLHVFSTIGSSYVVNTKETIPLDVVFILDFSTSMANTYYQSESRFQQTVDAVNDAINTIISLSPDSRVGIATYGKTATKLMPLVKPVPDAGKTDTKWLEITKYDFPDLYDVSTAVIRNKSAKRATSASGWEDTTINNTVTLTGATNLQAGLAAGMGMLADDPVTTWKSSKSNIEYGRIPVVMIMTDGGCNTLCTSNDSSDTNDAKAWYDTNYESRRNTYADDSYNDNRDLSYTITPVTVSTLLTAAYNTARIDAHYAANTPKHKKDNSNGTGVAYVYGIGVDKGSLNSLTGPFATPKINTTLNPRMFFNANPPASAIYNNNYLYDFRHRIKDAYNHYQNWYTGNATLNIGRLRSGSTSTGASDVDMYIAQLPAGHSPSKQDVYKNIYYTDEYMDVDVGELSGVFKDIIGEVAGEKSEVFTPVSGSNDAGVNDALTYMDPIGKYMEVKAIKNVLLFGELYEVTEKGETQYYFRDGREATADSYAYSMQYYKIAGEDKAIANPCYGENSGVTFNLSEIEIYVKHTGNYQDDTVEGGGIESDTGNDQSLYVNIPANALPMQVANVLIDDGEVIYNTNLADKTQSTPIRVFYEVGIAEEIKTANKNIDMTKVDPDYINANKVEDGDSNMVYFYSNWYADKKHTDYVDGVLTSYDFGDPALTFSLDQNNSYYLFKDYVLLHDEDGNPIRGMASNTTYHMDIEYYTPEGRAENKQEQRTGDNGSMPGDTDKIALAYGEALCWYNPDEPYDNKKVLSYLTDDGTAVRTPPEGYYIATRKGAVAMGDMSKNVVNKKPGENKTETSGTAYLPTYSSSTDAGANKIIINTYLGNNGRLAVSNTQLLVMKTVENDDENSISADEVFEYTIQLAGQKIPDQAIKATREIDGTWRALIESIELISNNKGLLVYNDRNPVAVDASGNVIDNPDVTKDDCYYIYIGGVAAADNFSYTLFDSKRGDNFHGMLGSNKPLYAEANLVSAKYYEENIDNWTYSEALKYKTIDEFPVGYVGFDSGTQIGFAVHMYYQSQSKYQTEQLQFDQNGRADFKLKDGEGLLFIGLDSGTDYTVTEKLTQDQFDAGIRLNKVEHTVNKGTEEDTHLHPASSVSGDHHKFGDKTYSVSGDTTASLTEKVHYINHPPKTSKRWVQSDDRGYVNLGEEVTYVIHWINDQVDAGNKPIPADVTITDPLDMGVDFVSAEFVKKITVKDGETTRTEYEPIADEEWRAKGWDWEYDENSRTVKWTITAAPEESGIVRLTVRVNKNAAVVDEKGNDLESPDNLVINRAHTVINGSEFDTNIVETPLNEFHKTEILVTDTASKGTDVGIKEGNLNQDAETEYFVGPIVGEEWEIKYKISFTNYKETEATVTITDKLDPDVDFVRAEYGEEFLAEKPLDDADEDGNITFTNNDNLTIKYNFDTRIVTWIISNVAPLESGEVYLTVKVKKNSVSEDKPAGTEGMTFERYTITGNVLEAGTYIMVGSDSAGDWAAENKTFASGNYNTFLSASQNFTKDGNTIKTSDENIMWSVEPGNNGSFYLKTYDGTKYLKGAIEASPDNKYLTYKTISLVDNKNEATPWKIGATLNNKGYLSNGNGVYFEFYGYGTGANAGRDFRIDAYSPYSESYYITFYKLEDPGPQPEPEPEPEPDPNEEWTGKAGDYTIHNRAYVRIDDDEKQETETMENPMKGSLTVEKRVIGVQTDEQRKAAAGKKFKFTIMLTAKNGTAIDPTKLDITGVTITWEKNSSGAYTGKGDFELEDGQSVTIEGIPCDVDYVVQETKDENFPLHHVTLNGENTNDASGVVQGTINLKETEMIFHNAPKGYIDLPSTGGKGVTIILIAGVNMVAAALYIRCRRRKNKCV